MEPKVQMKIMVGKMGAQLKQTNRRLTTVQESLEVAVSGISELLEKGKSMKEDMKAIVYLGREHFF